MGIALAFTAISMLLNVGISWGMQARAIAYLEASLARLERALEALQTKTTTHGETIAALNATKAKV